MKTILKSSLSVIIPTGYLIWLAIVLSSHPPDAKILAVINWVLVLSVLTNMLLPQAKSLCTWLCRVPAFLMVVSWLWFHFRLSPPESRYLALIACAGVIGLSVVVWLLDRAYRKWWPTLPMVPKVVLMTTGIILSAGAALYLLSVLLKGVNWHDILITNWYVTVLVLYLPIFLGVLFFRSVLERRKTERQPDA